MWPALEPLPALRASSDAAAFEYAASGALFVPRGTNYIRLNNASGQANGPGLYHSTFSEVHFNATECSSALAEMATQGFNVVRVFLDAGDWARFDGINGNGTEPLSSAYLDNVARFLRMSIAHRVYVMVTLYSLPINKYFQGRTCGVCQNSTGPNRQYLDPTHVEAKSEYAAAVVAGIRSRLGADLMSVVFALSLENEAAFFVDELPFSRRNITVTLADGLEYNMGLPEEREAAADANAVHWANSVTAAVVAVHPVMVTVGMFTFLAVGKAGPSGLVFPASTDVRYPFRPIIIGPESALDFLDVHVYPVGLASGWSLDKDLASEEWGQLPGNVTVLMGEFGAFYDDFKTTASVGPFMAEMQSMSCARRFSGWLYWTWDTWEQTRLHYMTEGDGSIGRSLSPVARPDPCHKTKRTSAFDKSHGSR